MPEFMLDDLYFISDVCGELFHLQELQRAPDGRERITQLVRKACEEEVLGFIAPLNFGIETGVFHRDTETLAEIAKEAHVFIGIDAARLRIGERERAERAAPRR